MSKILENRAKQYRDLERRWECDGSFVAKVIARDGTTVGYTEEFATSYNGPAGASSRLPVVGEDGRTTLCSVKGMEGSQPNEDRPGGFRVWRIR